MDLEKTFGDLGGRFLTSSGQIQKSLEKINAFIFDWDGVFNNGMKNEGSGSTFSEIDSMGINLMRFSFWLKTGNIPLCFIITGMDNNTAAGFARREHFQGIVMNLKKKKLALDAICNTFRIESVNTAFIFDDVIDIETAKACGLSFYVRRPCNPLLNDYVINNRISDYITGFSGENHAVREVCELITGLNGNFKITAELRINFAPEYEKFLKIRDLISTDTGIKI